MKKQMVSLLLLSLLAAPVMTVRADDTNATGNNNDPLKHPVNAYTNHEVKEDMKDSQENSQKAAEAKATYEQAKKDYDKSLKDNGPDSPVTKDARKRKHDAHMDMHKYNKKTAKANKELRADEIKAHQ